MSKGVDLRVSRSIELLGQLKQTVSEFAKKEDRLLRDLRTRSYVATRVHEGTIEKIQARLAAEIASADSALAGDDARLRAIYDGRLTRIRRAHAAAVRDLPRHAQEAKGIWLGRLQMKQVRAERNLTSDLKAADEAFGKLSASLMEQRAVLTDLDGRMKGAFGGYGKFKKLAESIPAANPDGDDPERLFEAAQERLRVAGEQLAAFQQFAIPRVFRAVPLPAVAGIIVAAGVALAFHSGFSSPSYGLAGVVTGLLLAAAFVIHGIGAGKSKATATATAGAISDARGIHNACCVAANAKHAGDRQRLKDDYDRTIAEIHEQWNKADDIEGESHAKRKAKIEAQLPRVTGKIERILPPKLARIQAARDAKVAEFTGEAKREEKQLTGTHQTQLATVVASEDAEWKALEDAWTGAITPLYRAVDEMNAATAAKFPPWDARVVEGWTSPTEFTSAAKFARLALDLSQHPETEPSLNRLALPGPPQVSIPLALTFPEQGSLLFETTESGGATVIGTINNVLLRLLSTTPPGKLSITVIDPVGLGQNFAGLMHLGDYEESLINRRIWTQREQIEERLAELNAHIEKVIQMYLRNEYATITEYNEQAGSVAEKYHFLVVADFPSTFSETAASRLQSIASSGPRCGVYMLIHWDQRQPLPPGLVPDELRNASVCFRREKNEFILGKTRFEPGTTLEFEPPPNPELALGLIHKIGKSSVDSNRVQVPFSQIAPKPSEEWTVETSSELRIAIGRTGATKLQYLAIGKGTRQHALFAGKTGSGKSTLFHVIITNLALACSPDQVEFYLIDFKKGVEFKCYASKRLPHARVVAIESDREFALSVLQRVDDELKRRGDMFRKLGVQDIAGYKRAGGTEPMPRSLLLIDEFQEFFVSDDSVAQAASLLFDRIVRQGRAFGIHVLLGSQSLGGAYSLARATIGQMVIRVALQCNEADAYLIMDDSNSAPRLLSRPGEGIYNDAGGAVEGNSPFQVVWLPDDERDEWLDKVRAVAKERNDTRPGPIVFEGNAPADIRENPLLLSLLDKPATAAPSAGRCWLGAPNSIKGPTEAAFRRQSGNHMLIVGQRDESTVTMLGFCLLALAAQYPIDAAKFVLIHSGNPESPESDFLGKVVAAIPHKIRVAYGHDIVAVMNEVTADLKARNTGGAQPAGTPPVFLFIDGLHRFKKLRHEDDFSFSSGDSEETAKPGAQLNDIISEGSNHGIHIITTVDTFNNLNRSISRKALTEFEMRVVFQMSANDSASLIDSPKAGDLGLHRSLFYNEHEGTLETFRPYAPPDATWLGEVAEKLRKLPA